MMDILLALAIVEWTFVLIVAALMAYGYVLEKIDRIRNKQYPHCDIDPLVHQAFSWKQDGSAWIGDTPVKVRGR